MQTKRALDAPAESAGEFAALAAAVHPAWHQAIIRLANSTERVAFRLEAFMGMPLDRGMAGCARELIKDLIDLLDQLDADPDLEPSCGVAYGQPPGADECEPPEDDEYSGDEHEPSLGAVHSLDQSHAWKGRTDDIERDDADSEDDDPDEAKQQTPEMCPCA
ncbi:hypothetical protein [Bradyrhizobium sp. CB2312]|uniref:hypothetical protein n=1 Tax=Bradyrhizobium sp. CB2312 TaxID=3039155 RepID=UPI0024B174B4|nr:hypothetical protein [Bradyrhizobium sp. CB2312]WFU68580.1 hypothetical protein QA642_24960 [Bradyrhizobium sp. CB2312]